MRKLVLCGMLIVGYVFADEQEFESWHFGDSITSESRQEAELESKRKSQWESAQKSYKAFEWRLALGYDVNFNTYSNKKINYNTSEVSGLDLTLGFLLRPVQYVSLELGAGIGTQSVKFSHNGKANHIDSADLAYVESILKPEFVEKVKDAMLSGDLSNVWNLFDWSKLNYDYQTKGYFAEGFTGVKFPFFGRVNYHINNDWIAYVGGVYNRGGLIDDARVFVGFNYKYFDMRVGYIAYTSTRFKDNKHARITLQGGTPISLSIGAVF